LVVHNKDGVSAYWFSMQVVNANKGVKSLEVSTDGGSTWQATARQDYNFFENSMGFGTTTVDVKVTSVDGDVVIVKDVNVSSGDSTTASSNFGSAAAPVAEQPMSTFSAIPLESYTSTTSTVEESTPAPTPNPEATESSLGTTTTTLPGGNFVETTAEAKTTAESPTSTHSTAAASTAASDTYTPSTSYSAEKTTSSTSTITQTKTKTKTEIPSTTLSTTAAPVRPTSLAAGIITNTTTTYPITSVGTSSSRLAGSSSLTLGLAATPSSSPLPFTGSASHSVAQFGGLFASLVLAVFNAF
jgi:hypothetical protein